MIDRENDNCLAIHADFGKEWKAVGLVEANNLGTVRVEQSEMQANAKLIAAAPELLGACRSAMLWLAYCEMTDTVQFKRLADAIAKATT